MNGSFLYIYTFFCYNINIPPILNYIARTLSLHGFPGRFALHFVQNRVYVTDINNFTFLRSYYLCKLISFMHFRVNFHGLASLEASGSKRTAALSQLMIWPLLTLNFSKSHNYELSISLIRRTIIRSKIWHLSIYNLHNQWNFCFRLQLRRT